MRGNNKWKVIFLNKGKLNLQSCIFINGDLGKKSHEKLFVGKVKNFLTGKMEFLNSVKDGENL